jgi:hypothetical protein
MKMESDILKQATPTTTTTTTTAVATPSSSASSSSSSSASSTSSTTATTTTTTSKAAATAEASGLTFGPAWLRHLSSGDSSAKQALPPSPALNFKSSKYRYSREEMLAIYDKIEKNLTQPPPSILNDFEDLLRKDTQRPVLHFQPSAEEQVKITIIQLN